MLFPALPDPAADHEREQARQNPDRDTLELAAAVAAMVLEPDHSATRSLTLSGIHTGGYGMYSI